MGDSRRASWSGRAFCRSLDPPAIEAYTQSQGLALFEIFLRITLARPVKYTSPLAATLWLLIEPLVKRTIPEGTSEKDVDLSREFVRERRASRRNKAAKAMIDGWSRLIAGTRECRRTAGRRCR
jgi:hypothetical protein